jgi:hypothetical protein
MSAPSAEAPTGSRRESALGVAGIAGGLLLIAALFLWLWMSRGREIDATEQLESSFALEQVPPGWTVALAQAVPDNLFSLSSELRIVRLVREGDTPDPEPASAPDAKVVWKNLLEGAPLGEAARLHLAWYDPKSGSKDVEQQLDSHGAVEMGMLDAQKGGIVRVDAGKLRWGAYDADFVQERLFEKGSFRDALRFNLSTPGQFCVLNVLWKRGEKGSREAAQRVLALFPPRTK